ncbi:MAG TPA: RNA polymerase sigma factor [Solirubrobacteraceae bacterium]
MSDEELLCAADRDPDAFAAFYRRHAPGLLAWALRRTRDREQAADLVAETFAAALEGCHRFDPARGSAAGWLYGIARHQAARLAERGAVERGARRRLGVARPDLDDEELERVVAGASVPATLSSALSDLPEDQRAAVQARVVDELGYDEIAAGLQTSEAVVRKRVSRGLAQLRETLEER